MGRKSYLVLQNMALAYCEPGAHGFGVEAASSAAVDLPACPDEGVKLISGQENLEQQSQQ
jgi:hypothetical protein